MNTCGETTQAYVPTLPSGSKALLRGLDMLDAVASGPAAPGAIARQRNLSRTTAQQLAAPLRERRHRKITSADDSSLGSKVLDSGRLARDPIRPPRVRRHYLETIAAGIGEPALRDAAHVLLADQAACHRRMVPSLRPGDRRKLRASAFGAALQTPHEIVTDGDLDAEVRTVAATVRGGDGKKLAALGIAAGSFSADTAQSAVAADAVAHAARAIRVELGWRPAEGHAGLRRAAARQLRDSDPPSGAPTRAIGDTGIADKRKRDRMGGLTR